MAARMSTPTYDPIHWSTTTVGALEIQFQRDGFIAVSGLLPEATIRAADCYASELLAQLDERPWAAGETYCQRFDIWTKVFSGIDKPEIARLFVNGGLHEITEAITGPAPTVGAIGSWVTPHGCGQAWHQDSWSDYPAHFVLNRIVFTRDYAREQGALLVVPGSHCQGDLPSGEPYDALPGQVAIVPQANTCVLLHSRVFHCVEKNVTDAPRIQFNRRATPANAPSDLTSRARFRNGTWDFKTGKPW